MLTKVERGSVPLPGNVSGMGVLPEYFNKHDIPVTYTDGTPGITCHVATNGQRFALSNLIGRQFNWNSVILDQVSYVDPDGNVKIFDIPKPEAVKITLNKEFTLGYVTKLNNLRWGFNLHINIASGMGQLVTDSGSPIIGAGFHFTNT